MLFCLLILLAGMIGIIVNDWVWVLLIAGALITMIANSFLWCKLPCPLCGGNLAGAINIGSWSWKINWKLGIPSQVKFCQYCGVSLDKEIEH
jgi:hypothetical protein